MDAVAAYICTKSGAQATAAAFDHAVAAGHFSSPHDALQRLFAWGADRNHTKLLRKLHDMKSALPSPPRVAVDPAIGSPRAVWEILLPDALARRDVAGQLELLQEAMVKCVIVDDEPVLRYVLATWRGRFPLEAVSALGAEISSSGIAAEAQRTTKLVLLDLCNRAIAAQAANALAVLLHAAEYFPAGIDADEKQHLFQTCATSNSLRCAAVLSAPPPGDESSTFTLETNTLDSIFGTKPAQSSTWSLPSVLAARFSTQGLESTAPAGTHPREHAAGVAQVDQCASGPGAQPDAILAVLTAAHFLSMGDNLASRLLTPRTLALGVAAAEPGDGHTAGGSKAHTIVGRVTAGGALLSLLEVLHSTTSHPRDTCGSVRSFAPEAAATGSPTAMDAETAVTMLRHFTGMCGQSALFVWLCTRGLWAHAETLVWLLQALEQATSQAPSQVYGAEKAPSAEIRSYTATLMQLAPKDAPPLAPHQTADRGGLPPTGPVCMRKLSPGLLWALLYIGADLQTLQGLWDAVLLCVPVQGGVPRPPSAGAGAGSGTGAGEHVQLCDLDTLLQVASGNDMADEFLEMVLFCSMQVCSRETFSWWLRAVPSRTIPLELFVNATECADQMPQICNTTPSIAFVLEAVRMGHARLSCVGETGFAASQLLQTAIALDAASNQERLRLQSFGLALPDERDSKQSLYIKGGCVA
mgnify:CR=1 FL=1